MVEVVQRVKCSRCAASIESLSAEERGLSDLSLKMHVARYSAARFTKRSINAFYCPCLTVRRSVALQRGCGVRGERECVNTGRLAKSSASSWRRRNEERGAKIVVRGAIKKGKDGASTFNVRPRIQPAG